MLHPHRSDSPFLFYGVPAVLAATAAGCMLATAAGPYAAPDAGPADGGASSVLAWLTDDGCPGTMNDRPTIVRTTADLNGMQGANCEAAMAPALSRRLGSEAAQM